jgi:hypothetical protein
MAGIITNIHQDMISQQNFVFSRLVEALLMVPSLSE